MVMHKQITSKRTGQVRVSLYITKRLNTPKIKQFVPIKKKKKNSERELILQFLKYNPQI